MLTPHNGLVGGSSPSRPTNPGNDLAQKYGLRQGSLNLMRIPRGFGEPALSRLSWRAGA